ncbi:MAG: hypothetical protein ACYC7A_08680 [Thermoanaerobaculia bacterium]
MAVITLLVIGAPVGIGILCWVWMQNSRASQRRMEDNDARMIALLEEQNALLRQLTNQR